MRIITNREIKYSSADATETAQADLAAAQAKKTAAKGGFFSKEKRDARKDVRTAKKEVRVALKAKAGARPLKSFVQGGVKKFHDILHPVSKNADGSLTKTLPNGTTENVAKSDVMQIPVPSALNTKLNLPPLLFDKKDLSGKAAQVVMDSGAPKVATVHMPSETTQLTADDGTIATYKNSDVEKEGADKKEGEGMSTTTKVLIAVGSVGLIGLVIYLIKRKK